MEDKTSAVKSLKLLAGLVTEEINKAVSEGNLLPREELFYQTHIGEFEYSEKGVKVGQTSGQYIIKKTWRSGYLANVIQRVKESDKFQIIVDNMASISADQELKRFEIIGGLISFLNELVNFYLPNLKHNDADIESLITTYLKRFNKEPLRFVAEAELTKIVVSIPSLGFEVPNFGKVLLRQIAAEDLEAEFPAYEFSIGDVKPYIRSNLGSLIWPSAVLRIECVARQVDEVAERINQALAILRLFGPAGIDILSHKIYVESNENPISIGGLSASYSGIDRYLNSFGLYQITTENADKLIDFWKQLVHKIPACFYKSGLSDTNHITLAYERYCDALIKTSMFEARIGSAVMGLEALFLPGSTEGELGFRLRTYIAKELGLLDYDPIDVKEVVKLAYTIRSAYVHGNKPSSKDKKALQYRYSDSSKFLGLILDYLRVAIIINLMIKSGKDNHLKLIEDALVSQSNPDLLLELLTITKNLL